jgi:hypothetical protein
MGSSTFDTLNSLTDLGSAQTWVPSRRLIDLRTSDVQNQIIALQNPPTEPGLIVSGTTVGTPDQVSGISATESPFKTQDGSIKSNVSVSFSVNPSDDLFDHVQIWFTGYNGNSQPQLMPGDARVSPANFLCDTTGETVTVTVVAIGVDGSSPDFAFAPTTTVLLDGVTSAPPAPSIAQNLIATPTGYQFAFNQLAGQAADQIDGYQVWRNTTNNAGTATRFQYFKHNPLNSTAVVVIDVAPNGTTYFYWVTSVNTTGLESSKTAVQSQTVGSGSITGPDGNPHTWTGRNLVFNSNFAIYAEPTGFQDPLASVARANDNDNSGTLQNSPNGWTRSFEHAHNGEGVIFRSSSTTLPAQGSYALVMQDRQGSTGDAFSTVSDAFPVTAGKQYRVSAMVSAGLGSTFPTHARWFFRILFYKTAATDFSRSSSDLSANTPAFTQPSSGFTPSATTGYVDIANSSTLTGTQNPAATVTAPADGAWARIAFYHWDDGTATATAWNLVVGDVTCKAITADGDAIFTVSTLLNGQGSILPNQSITFTKAAETTTTTAVRKLKRVLNS